MLHSQIAVADGNFPPMEENNGAPHPSALASTSLVLLLPSPRFCAPLFPFYSQQPSPRCFVHFSSVALLFSSYFLRATCQHFTRALIVSRLWSQKANLQESKMSERGRPFQCHSTQRTRCDRAKINGTCIHHLTLSGSGFGDVLSVRRSPYLSVTVCLKASTLFSLYL